MSRYLTKSRFKQAIECPKKLFYTNKKEYKDNKSDDTFLQSLADGGFQVGELAKKLYPNGIEIQSKDNDQALLETSEHLKKDNVILFEPAIAYKNLLVRVDILIKRGNIFELIEVKAKSIDSQNDLFETSKGIKSTIKPYIEDVAYQTYVLKKAFPNAVVTSYLLMPDKSQSATLDQMNQFFKVKRVEKKTEIIQNNIPKNLSFKNSLLYPLNVDHLIKIVNEKGIDFPGGNGPLDAMVKIWAEAYEDDMPINVPIGAHCQSCEYRVSVDGPLKSGFHECWKDSNSWDDSNFDEPLSIELWNFRGKKNFFNSFPKKLYLSDLNQEDIDFQEADQGLSNSERQWLQINGLPEDSRKKGYYHDKEFFEAEISSWNYPLHFIDFETSAVALPFHEGMKPYESVAFQFSHHILEKDGTLHHADQFLLAKAGCFPNYDFVRSLKNTLSVDDGSVFMWANHENTILKHIAHQLEFRSDTPIDKDELIAFIKTLIKGGSRAMIDLKTIAQRSYFHPQTKGSNSIKKVLPAVLMSSPFLKSKYSQPIYGAKRGIKSLNFDSVAWWSQNSLGVVGDPYKKLLDQDFIPLSTEVLDSDNLEISEGGAAAMAYGRLQFEDLNPEARISIEKKLYKYCELDTLAMAMIVEAWLSDLE